MPNNNRTAAIYDPSGNLRIRKPNPHDVLSGRGGGINSHSGNKVFREWVRVRKEDYNLAVTKAEKAEVAHQVMELVQQQTPPGRFLQRDTNITISQTSSWVELDANRALAKTSQALREGAPQIRAAHKEGMGCKKERARKSKRKPQTSPPPPRTTAPTTATKKSATTTTTKTIAQATTTTTTTPLNKAIRALQDNVDQAKRLAASSLPVPPPLLSNQDFEAKLTRFPKRGKFLHPPPLPEDSASTTTPTLTSIPASLTCIPSMPAVEAPVGGLSCDTNKLLLRTHSLAWSDFSNTDTDRMEEEDLNQDFVNPFDDESDIYSIQNVPRSGEVKSFNNNNNGRNNSNLNSRYVSPAATAVATKTNPSPKKPNCYCNCDRGECICSDLADHFLHRVDGLQFCLHDHHHHDDDNERRDAPSSSR